MAGDIDTHSDENEKAGNKPENSDGNFDSDSKSASGTDAGSLNAATNSARASDVMSAEVFDRSRDTTPLESPSGAIASQRESETPNNKSDKSDMLGLPELTIEDKSMPRPEAASLAPPVDKRIDVGAGAGERDGKESTEKTSAETHDIIRTMWRLESQYNVKFKLPGDTYRYEEANSKEKKPEVRVPIRMPTAEELKVVEETLKKFGHLANPKKPNDFEGMRIGFVAATGNGTKFAELGIHEGGKPSSIHFGPRTATKTRGWTGLEGVATHEFTHQLQEKWKKNGVEKVPAELEKFFGYEEVAPKKKGDDPTYRVSDKDGNKWEHTKYEENGEQKEAWLPVESGQPSADKSRGIDDEEMRKRMPPEKQPATNYFYHPQEAHAEAIGLYVIDPITLYDANPELYWQTKKWDQDALTARYGSKKDEYGQTVPRMIRGADGFIVPNTKEKTAPIAERERLMKASTPSRKPTEAHSNGRCSCHHRPAT